jgi:hypothetical protein
MFCISRGFPEPALGIDTLKPARERLAPVNERSVSYRSCVLNRIPRSCMVAKQGRKFNPQYRTEQKPHLPTDYT